MLRRDLPLTPGSVAFDGGVSAALAIWKLESVAWLAVSLECLLENRHSLTRM